MKKDIRRQIPFPRLKRAKIPRYMVFTDTETEQSPDMEGNVQVFKMGWAFLWDTSKPMDDKYVKTYFFTDHVEYCAFFDTLPCGEGDVYVYAHNIFFDLQGAGFFKYMRETGWQADWVYSAGLTYMFRIIKGKEKLFLLSTTNYFDCKLEELGKLIGLKKLEVDFGTSTEEELKTYCYRDTEIIMRAVWYYLDFVKENELGGLAPSKSSQAMKAYRTRFMDKKLFRHNIEEATALEREAYMGGRTEMFKQGQNPEAEYIKLDINSMYPYVMKKYAQPRELVNVMSDEPFDEYVRVLKGYGMIAEVLIDTPEPAFPVRDKGKLMFKTGCFRTVLCTESLKYALSKGYIRQFYRANVYLMDDLFSAYVDYFYELRYKYTKYNLSIMVKLCKYLHNSLYGKFGQKAREDQVLDNDTDIAYKTTRDWDFDNKFWVSITYLMNKIFVKLDDGETNTSMPFISAHITDQARLELWQIMKPLYPGKVYYCDTDSLIIKASDLSLVDHKIDEHELGALKVEGRTDKLYIGGAKNYRFGDDWHIKGIPQKAKEVEPGVYEFESFQSQVACMKEGRETGVKITTMTRHVSLDYDKGIVSPDGWVTPFHCEFSDLQH
jgi:hypothetical protein